MADNVAVTPGSGATIAADEVTDGTLGTVKVQYIKLMDGTIDGLNKATVKAASTAAAAGDPALVVGLSPNGVTRAAGAADANTIRVTMDNTQLAALATAYDVLNNAGGGQKVYLSTDQVVSNKVQAQTSGATPTRVNAAATTNATNLKASAGAIVEIDLFNAAAYDVFFKLYNMSAAPTVGSSTVVWTIPIKAGTGYARDFKYGKWFSTGISYAITKVQLDSDATAVALNDVTGTIDWI